jgi:chorismate lyase / 3-hydroxybenzoate synthase
MTAKWDAMAAAGGTRAEPPAWVEKIIGADCTEMPFEVDRFTSGTIRDAGDLSLTAMTVRDADDLDPLTFQRQTVVAYRALARVLQEREARSPIRFWNFIPDINKRIGDSISRYMVFNAGRFSAFHEWYGQANAFGRDVATASGVGHAGRDLVVHCLSSSVAGKAIENPRQIPSYHYSAQFGPLPPTFARATAVQLSSLEDSLLLVGGTASIRGERSIHDTSLVAQTSETLQNLAAVVRAGHAEVVNGHAPAHSTECNWLERFVWLRVYHPQSEDRSTIAGVIAERFPHVEQVEWRHAHLCRPELLVEIEGVARLPRIKAEAAHVPSHRQRAALEA